MVQARNTSGGNGSVDEIGDMARSTVSRSAFTVSQVTPVILGIHHSVGWGLGHRAVGILVAVPAVDSIVMGRGD
jgi:hypothetical protein